MMANYQKYAALLARFPECQMFRKFEKLSILMVLYLQAELVTLEQELEVFSELDDKNADTKDISKCWENMQTAFRNGKALMQKDKIQEVQEKLKTYHEMLFRITHVHRLAKPMSYNHEFVNQWLSSSEGGDNFLEMFEATPWQPKFEPDLVSLLNTTDGFDRRLVQILMPIFHFFGRHGKADTDPELGIGKVWEYKQSSFIALGNVCCMIFSVVMPLGSVFALLFVTNLAHRLLLIAMFTIVFTSLLGFATTCRRSEIFAATAAFVAIQVVFLQGVIGIQSG